MPTNKYIIRTDISKQLGDNILYRIQSLRQIRPLLYANNPASGLVIPSGKLGGWVSGYHNLSQDGECWIGEQAMVFQSGSIQQAAYINGHACVYGSAIVAGHAHVYDYAQIFDTSTVDVSRESTLPILSRIRLVSAVSFIKQYIYQPWDYETNIIESIGMSYYNMYLESTNNIYTYSINNNLRYKAQFITASIYIKNEYIPQWAIAPYEQKLYRKSKIGGRAWIYGHSIVRGGVTLLDDADINNSLIDGYFVIGGNTKCNLVSGFSERYVWSKVSDIYAHENTSYLLDDVQIVNSYLNLFTYPDITSRQLNNPLQYTTVIFSNSYINNSGVTGYNIIDYNIENTLDVYSQSFQIIPLWQNKHYDLWQNSTSSVFTININSVDYALMQISQLLHQIGTLYDEDVTISIGTFFVEDAVMSRVYGSNIYQIFAQIVYGYIGQYYSVYGLIGQQYSAISTSMFNMGGGFFAVYPPNQIDMLIRQRMAAYQNIYIDTGSL